MSLSPAGGSRITFRSDSKQVLVGAVPTSKGKSMLQKRERYKIIIDGIDYTPKPLLDPMFSSTDERQISPRIFTGRLLSTFGSPSQSSTFDLRMSGSTSLRANLSLGNVFLEMEGTLESSLPSKGDYVLDEEVPPQFLLPAFPYEETPSLPKQVTITLKETPTFYLFDRPSITEVLGTKEAEEVLRQNEHYEKLKTGGTIKKTAESEAQTPDPGRRPKMTLAKRCRRHNAGSNVTTFDIYQTYKKLPRISVPYYGRTVLLQDPLKEEVKEKVTEEDEPTESCELFSSVLERYENEFIEIASGRRFKKAVFLMERFLASNEFEKEQKIFKGITQPDPFRLDISFEYLPVLLWTYRNDTVTGRSVTGMCWNPKNSNLLAVSYGKHYSHYNEGGIVCCWCIKNPVQPERTFEFAAPVQTLEFSDLSPNLLALGFYNGDVMIIDISTEELSIVARNNADCVLRNCPLWAVTWFRGDDYQGAGDQVYTVGQDGRIIRYHKGHDFIPFVMMRVCRAEGRLKGIAIPRQCAPNLIPITCNPAALVLVKHPNDKDIYYVGTDEGCIHRCSVHYLHFHLDCFQAHNGPIYSMQFSPFTDKIFLTSGADFYVRIWAMGIDEPLIELHADMAAVVDACWSPVNSTILASVSGESLHIWDIHRKTFSPMSTIPSPSSSVNTCVEFSPAGDCIVVSDVQGNVRVYSLTKMPFSPLFPNPALAHALVSALVLRPDLVKQLEKIHRSFAKHRWLDRDPQHYVRVG